MSGTPTAEAGAAAAAAAGLLLPSVALDAPAGVLLVETASGAISYASRVACQLAPDLSLPFGLVAWAEAAGFLQHPDGESGTPALRALVAGTASGGRLFSAQRGSDISGRREVLWATAVPLAEASGLSAYTLLVFLPLRDLAAGSGQPSDPETAAIVRERAVVATGLSFTVADLRAPEQPLVWVNPAFSAATGYSFEEAVGANCRFLQGPDTDTATRVEIRRAIDAGEALTTVILNYRKDGSPFWNELALNPIHDGAGTLTHYVGIQTDVTERRRVELEREEALREAQAARTLAETTNEAVQQSRRRLALLAEASSLLSRTLDIDDTFERLIALVLPLLADWVVIDVNGAEGLDPRVVVRHRDGMPELVAEIERVYRGSVTGDSLTLGVREAGEPLLISDYTEEVLARSVATEEGRALIRRLGLRSGLSVPLVARGRQLGAMTFMTGPSGRGYGEDDLRLVSDLGRRVGIALDNARLYSIEHSAALTLQRALLPDLPDLPGVEATARYRPGHAGAAVGGDFYELLPLPDGGIGIAIGDIVGHDMAAAGAMGHLRGLLRACAWDTAADGSGLPAKVLARVDRLVQGLHVAPLATVFYGRLDTDPDAGGPGWLLRWANAGHPPPVLRSPDGTARALTDGTGLLLGVELGDYETLTDRVEPGSTLVCYTDGLVERRGVDLDLGIDWLVREVAAAPLDASPDALADRLLADVADTEDDIALLVVRLSGG